MTKIGIGSIFEQCKCLNWTWSHRELLVPRMLQKSLSKMLEISLLGVFQILGAPEFVLNPVIIQTPRNGIYEG